MDAGCDVGSNIRSSAKDEFIFIRQHGKYIFEMCDIAMSVERFERKDEMKFPICLIVCILNMLIVILPCVLRTKLKYLHF